MTPITWPIDSTVDLTGTKCYVFIRDEGAMPSIVVEAYNGVSVTTPTFTTELADGFAYNAVFMDGDVAVYSGNRYTGTVIVGEAPTDGKSYVRKNGGWVELQGGSGGGIPEAPVDGAMYARQDEDWTSIKVKDVGYWVPAQEGYTTYDLVWLEGTSSPAAGTAAGTLSNAKFYCEYVSDGRELPPQRRINTMYTYLSSDWIGIWGGIKCLQTGTIPTSEGVYTLNDNSQFSNYRTTSRYNRTTTTPCGFYANRKREVSPEPAKYVSLVDTEGIYDPTKTEPAGFKKWMDETYEIPESAFRWQATSDYQSEYWRTGSWRVQYDLTTKKLKITYSRKNVDATTTTLNYARDGFEFANNQAQPFRFNSKIAELIRAKYGTSEQTKYGQFTTSNKLKNTSGNFVTAGFAFYKYLDGDSLDDWLLMSGSNNGSANTGDTYSNSPLIHTFGEYSTMELEIQL
jgi:hypothetical protein